MRSALSSYLTSIMLLSNSIWAAYGIRSSPGVDKEGSEDLEMHTLRIEHMARSSPPKRSLVLDSAPTPSSLVPVPMESIEPAETIQPSIDTFNAESNTPTATPVHEPTLPAAPSAAPAAPSSGLSLSGAAIAGLCIGLTIALLLIILIILALFVRRRRRLLKEEGEERAKRLSARYERRVENWVIEKDDVLVDEVDVVDKEAEMGRKGMSLPRRVW